MYLVLDLHSAPGGQSDLFTADPGKVLLWDSEANKKRTIALWHELAKHYKDSRVVAGYELLNEPTLKKGSDLVDLYRRIISAVREIDQNHLVIIDGADFAKDFSMFHEPLDENMVYAFHTYNLFFKDKTRGEFKEVVSLSKKQNIPIWNSEFGAHTFKWTKDTLDIFENPS